VEGLADDLTMNRLVTMANRVGYVATVFRPGDHGEEALWFDGHLPTGARELSNRTIEDVTMRGINYLDDGQENWFSDSGWHVVKSLNSVAILDPKWSSNRLFEDVVDALEGKYDEHLEGLGMFR
jgi:hypothetical protein